MPKMKIRLRKGEGKTLPHLAQVVLDRLIAEQGTRKAFLIARLVHEKAFANYKSMERKYPDEEVN